MAPSDFKVIIVGGGPVGLAAAHALHLARLDFVVLERRESVIEDVGASLVLAPTTLRVLHQFGLLDKLSAVSAELKRVQSFTREGYKFKDTDGMKIMTESLGSAPRIFHRADLVQILYEGLPQAAKDKVLAGKRVVDIEQTDDVVKATCDDGSSFEGSVVIGADGVHSRTRREMRKGALLSNPSATWDEEQPFVSHYRCLWCSFDRPADTEPGLGGETQHQDRSIMYLAGKDKGWIFLYEKLPSATRERVNYTSKDIDQFAAIFADWPVSETLKLKDVFNKKTAGMSNLDEGILQHWSSGRIVLTGDACHKFTPNAGQGLNNGIQDVVAVCNGLHKAVVEAADGEPSLASLSKVFGTYRTSRESGLKGDFTRSAAITRMQAWKNVWYYLASRYLMTLIEGIMLRYVAIPKLRQEPILNYVKGEEPYVGSVKWLYPLTEATGKAL